MLFPSTLVYALGGLTYMKLTKNENDDELFISKLTKLHLVTFLVPAAVFMAIKVITPIVLSCAALERTITFKKPFQFH